ncbi:MAG: hypothetical protein ACE1ZP_06820 [Myxococcota bacterium]
MSARLALEPMPIRGAYYTHLEAIGRGRALKLLIDIQAWGRTAEEKHSEVGGNGSELPPR